jgi:tetratricopeptide (TPR) repeat protein
MSYLARALLAASFVAATSCSTSGPAIKTEWNVEGSYRKGGAPLKVSHNEMRTGSRHLPFSNGLKISGDEATFSNAVLKKGLIFDDTCSGAIQRNPKGITVSIKGDAGCNDFEGTWEFDSTEMFREAQALIANLQFRQAKSTLSEIHPNDEAGKAASVKLLASPEVVAGLEWEGSTGDALRALDKMKELVGLNGSAAPSGRRWLQRKADEACQPALPRSACLRYHKVASDLSGGDARATQLLASVAEKVTKGWMTEGITKEGAGKASEAIASYHDICAVGASSAVCTQAAQREGALLLRLAGRDIALGRFASARESLDAAVACRHEPSRAEAKRLLESATFGGGSALEEAEKMLKDKGPTDETVAALDAVCARGPTSPYCNRAKGLSSDAQLKLATADVQAGKFESAEKRFNALLVVGGINGLAAKKTLGEKSFQDGLVSERNQQRAKAAVKRCDERSGDCKAVADAALGDLGQSPQADEVRASLARFEQAVQANPAAVKAVEQVLAKCRMVGETERYAAACFPPEVPTGTAGPTVTPTVVERASLAVANVLLGRGISPGRVTFGMVVAVGWLGAALGLMSGLSQQGRGFRGLVYAVLMVAALVGAVVGRGALRQADESFQRVGVGAER